MSTLRVGLCGLGTVGGAVFRLLSEDGGRLAERGVELVHLASRSLGEEHKRASVRCSSRLLAVAEDPELDVVVELVGGVSDARTLVLRALEQGKHVVTANKALLAEHGDEIFAAARTHGRQIACEAAVAGGIPVLRALGEGLVANRVRRIAGIINGTSNFILSAMRERGTGFAEAVQEAQHLGYAEADASLDTGGGDAAHKLVLLAALAWGVPLPADGTAAGNCIGGVYCEPLEFLEREDFAWAHGFDYCIKPLAVAERCSQPDGVMLRVHPALVHKRHILARVDGVMNAVLVEGDVVGETLYYGAGAGGEATASAVLADLCALAAGRGGMMPPRAGSIAVLAPDTLVCKRYLRLRVSDRPGVLAAVSRMLADAGINVLEAQQKPDAGTASTATLALLLDQTAEQHLLRVLQEIERLEEVRAGTVHLRVESFGAVPA